MLCLAWVLARLEQQRMRNSLKHGVTFESERFPILTKQGALLLRGTYFPAFQGREAPLRAVGKKECGRNGKPIYTPTPIPPRSFLYPFQRQVPSNLDIEKRRKECGVSSFLLSSHPSISQLPHPPSRLSDPPPPHHTLTPASEPQARTPLTHSAPGPPAPASAPHP